MKIISQSIAETLANPLAQPLEVVSKGPRFYGYAGLDFMDRALTFAANAACTGAVRSITPVCTAVGMGKEAWDRGGSARLLCGVPAAFGLATGFAYGTAGAMVNGAEVVGGLVGAGFGAAASVLEITLQGMQSLV